MLRMHKLTHEFIKFFNLIVNTLTRHATRTCDACITAASDIKSYGMKALHGVECLHQRVEVHGAKN